MKKYFRWCFDGRYTGDPWFIDEPYLSTGQAIDIWQFTNCARIEVPRAGLLTKVLRGRERTQATFGAFDLPYLRDRMASALLQMASEQIQLVPVKIENSDEQVFILLAMNEVRCIDDERSEYRKFLPENAARPDKVGEYESITKLIIDSNRVQGLDIFRPWGWKVALIVSERLKAAIEKVGAQGTRFQEVYEKPARIYH